VFEYSGSRSLLFEPGDNVRALFSDISKSSTRNNKRRPCQVSLLSRLINEVLVRAPLCGRAEAERFHPNRGSTTVGMGGSCLRCRRVTGPLKLLGTSLTPMTSRCRLSFLPSASTPCRRHSGLSSALLAWSLWFHQMRGWIRREARPAQATTMTFGRQGWSEVLVQRFQLTLKHRERFSRGPRLASSRPLHFSK